MRNAFLAALFLGTFSLIATAQDSVTITSDPRDLSRPISSLINQIRQREKVSVTYEDPRYLSPADTENVTAEASKSSELEKAYRPRILVPKGHPITFVYATARMNGRGGAKVTIERMLQAYASVGRPVFAAIGDDVRLHVVPREVLDPSGTRVHQGSILESPIRLPPARRDGGELLQAICHEIQKQTGYEVGIGPSVPGNYLARYHTRAGVQKKTARAAIAELLDRASVAGIFDWDLYYDPADKAYTLNFAYGPARPMEKKIN
jgi:hypothetical protein